jgi:hypothetical protein
MKRTRASKRATMTKRAMATATWVAGDEEGNGDGGRSGGEGDDVNDDTENNDDNDDKDNDEILAKASAHKEIHFILNWKKCLALSKYLDFCARMMLL